MKRQATQAFILDYKPFSNSSPILSLLTQQQGVQKAVARGFRQGKTKFMPISLALYNANIKISNSGLGGVSNLELQQAYNLKGKSLLVFDYINRLILLCFQNYSDNSTSLFELYKSLIEATSQTGTTPLYLLRELEWHLLELIGYPLILETSYPDFAPIEKQAQYKLVYGQSLYKTTDTG